MSGLDEEEERVAWWWLGLKEIVFHGHHRTDRWRGLCYGGCVALSEGVRFGLFDVDLHVAGWVGVGYQCNIIGSEVDRGWICHCKRIHCILKPRKAIQSIAWYITKTMREVKGEEVLDANLIGASSGRGKVSMKISLYRNSGVHRWWRDGGGCGSQGTEVVHLKWERESAIELSKPGMWVAVNAKLYWSVWSVITRMRSITRGGLGVFRVYAGHHWLVVTPHADPFSRTCRDCIKYKPSIWEIAPAIQY